MGGERSGHGRPKEPSGKSLSAQETSLTPSTSSKLVHSKKSCRGYARDLPEGLRKRVRKTRIFLSMNGYTRTPG